MKKLFAAVGMVGAASLAFACAVDATSTGEGELVGESQDAISQWECTDPNGIAQNLKYQYEAQLAVTALGEMGDLEMDQNFRLEYGSYGKLMLQQAGLDKCAAKGKAGCPGTSFLLALQTLNSTQSGIPNWNPSSFRNILESHYKRFKDVAQWTWTGCGDSRGNPIRMTVIGAGTSNDGVCAPYGVKDSLNYWYQSSVPGKLWCKFAGFGGAYGQNGTGNPENPFMVYVQSNGLEGVDPVGGDMYGRPLQPIAGQGCGNTAPTVGAFVYTSPMGNTVSQADWIGACCYVNGRNGTYQRHPLPAFSNTHVYCRT